MHRRRTAALALPIALAALTACQRSQGGAGPDITPPADRPPAVAAASDARPERPTDYVIVGEATYRERIKAPPGARLDVHLVDTAAPAGAAPVAQASVRDVAGPPMPFALPYDPARLRGDGRYALQAALVAPSGEVWFASPAPVPVVPGEGLAVEVLLVRWAAGAATAPAAAGTLPPVSHWECGEFGVMARRTGAGLELAANGRRWPMRASGDRFADPAGNAFRRDGTGARLALRGEPARDCVPARQASPWNRALLAGIDFRAVGNEPGWYVEVDRGTAPALRATLAYGERRLTATRVEATSSGFRGVGADGQRIELDVDRGPCVDGMSGQRFEATARLRVGGETFDGCGAFLAD